MRPARWGAPQGIRGEATVARAQNVARTLTTARASRIAVTALAVLAIAAPSPALAGRRVDLPIAKRTPGATNPAVTQANIAKTICVAGWTATVRPSSSYTTALKVQQLASGYAAYGHTATADYEEDHLISLELGGSPDSPKNLWPEPYFVSDGARVKDRIENRLHSLVCAGTLSLRAAQKAIARNWEAAYARYLGPVPPAGGSLLRTPSPVTASSSASATRAIVTSAARPAGATAQCKDGTWSFSHTHSGTCSRHGGVARWLTA